MTKQIKASEVKPGMTVKFDMDGWHVEGTVSRVEPVTFGLDFYSTQGVEMTLGEDTPVTVLAEPRPEEPKAFGACVRVDGVEYIRDGVDDLWFTPKLIDYSRNHRWEDITARGQVEVVNPNPFARAEDVHEDTPKTPAVPDRIEEWPENDTALRAYPWRDDDGYGDIWRYGSNSHGEGWTCGYLLRGRPAYGPWTRETDA